MKSSCTLQLATVCGAMIIVYSIICPCMAVLWMQPTTCIMYGLEGRLMHGTCVTHAYNGIDPLQQAWL